MKSTRNRISKLFYLGIESQRLCAGRSVSRHSNRIQSDCLKRTNANYGTHKLSSCLVETAKTGRANSSFKDLAQRSSADTRLAMASALASTRRAMALSFVKQMVGCGTVVVRTWASFRCARQVEATRTRQFIIVFARSPLSHSGRRKHLISPFKLPSWNSHFHRQFLTISQQNFRSISSHRHLTTILDIFITSQRCS